MLSVIIFISTAMLYFFKSERNKNHNKKNIKLITEKISNGFHQDLDNYLKSIIRLSEQIANYPVLRKEKKLKKEVSSIIEDFPAFKGVFQYNLKKSIPAYYEPNAIKDLLLTIQLDEKAFLNGNTENNILVSIQKNKNELNLDSLVLLIAVPINVGVDYLVSIVDLDKLNSELVQEYNDNYDIKILIDKLLIFKNFEVENKNLIESEFTYKGMNWSISIYPKDNLHSEDFFKNTKLLISMLLSFGICLVLIIYLRLQSIEKNEAINESKTKLNLIQKITKVGLWEWDISEEYVSFDQNWCDMLGIKESEVLNSIKFFKEVIHPDDFEVFNNKLISLVNSEENNFYIECRMKHSNGNWINVINEGSIVERNEEKQATRFVATQLNVSNLKKAQELAFQKEDSIEAILNSSPDIMMVLDSELVLHSYFNGSEFRFKDENELIIGERLSEFINLEMSKLFKDSIGECLKLNNVVTIDFQLSYLNKKFDFCAKVSSVKNGRALIVMRDKTDEIKAKLNYVRDHRIIESLFERAPFGLVYIDMEGFIQKCNDSFMQLVEIMDATILDKNITDLLVEESKEKLKLVIRNLNNSGNNFNREFKFVTQMGPIKITKMTSVLIQNEDGNRGVWIIIEDLTIKKEMEQVIEQERLKATHASKMAALGEMSGGVAHEINNPLTIADGYSRRILRLLKDKEIDKEKLIELAETIMKTLQRIASIVKGLKTISRDADNDPIESVSLREVLDSTLEFCLEKCKYHKVELNIEKFNDVQFQARKIQINQVLLNIINNAFDAVNQQENAWIRINSSVDDKRLKIRIMDSGNGISEERLEKIFNPFFTTKDIGEGSGLGMSISKGIINSHKGHLIYELFEGHTSFLIDLPLSQS